MPPMFDIVAERASASRSRNTRGIVAEVRFHPMEQQRDQLPEMALEALITAMFQRVLSEHAEPPAFIGLQLQPPNFAGPFTIGLKPPEQNNARALAAAITRLNEQSAANIDLTDGLTTINVLAAWRLNADRADQQQGGACADHQVTPQIRSLVRVVNPRDRLCLARAVLLGLHHRREMQHGGGGNQAFRRFSTNQQMHGPEARNLLRRAGIARDKLFYTLEDVDCLQQWADAHFGAGEVRIVVVHKEEQYRIIYKGGAHRQRAAANFNLCLLLERRHYSYIARIEQLFNAHQYCVDCENNVGRLHHFIACPVACHLCLRFGREFPCRAYFLPTGQSSAIRCADCLFVFENADCFAWHRRQQQQDPMDGRGARPFRSLCQERYVCRQCAGIVYARAGEHECRGGQYNRPRECRKCRAVHAAEDPCFIQPLQCTNILEPRPVGWYRNRNEEEEEQEDEEEDDRDNVPRPTRLCLFDIETTQDQPMQLAGGAPAFKHVPLLLIAEVICEFCIRDGIGLTEADIGRRAVQCVCGMATRGRQAREWCSPPFRNAPGDQTPIPQMTYNPRRLFFHCFDRADANPVDQFLNFLTRTGPRQTLTIAIAHNGGRYDNHLVLDALQRRNEPPKALCTTGLKIYSMTIGGNNKRKIIFKDSLNFFFTELDALPRTFDLPRDVCTSKPFFPYMFIQRQHLHERLIGRLPDQEFYQPGNMKTAKRAQFLQWYEEQNANPDTNFQLREQLILYCANDVAILRESVLRFRQLIAENAQGLDPFVEASTAAGLALVTMRRCFLQRNTLINSPEGGYLRGRRASMESQRYIRLFELEHPEAAGQVQCAAWSIGEAHVEDTGYRLDGLWNRPVGQRPLAIEYMGCFYHGCIKCFPLRGQKLAAGRTAEQLYQRTMNRLWELEHVHGYELHVVWGCELKQRLRADSVLCQQYNEIFIPGRPMDPRRDALRGGRTEPFKLHHVCGPDEEIVAIDINSLYPGMMKIHPYPVGSPRVMTRNQILQNYPLPWRIQVPYLGLIFCRVLAPVNLRIPLLAYLTSDGRLTFPLCGKCAEENNHNPCHHSDQQRAWIWAYTHVELNLALELGYNILDVFEVWHYERWDDQLFRNYMNTFIAIKVQASGWPANCETDEQRQQFIEEFERAEGIRLDPAKMIPNPGLRHIAKILLNSLWGKFAQRVGRTEVRYANTPEEFHKLLFDPTLETLHFMHVSEHLDRVIVRKRPEFSTAPRTNCLPIAIFVTSYARVHLYRYLQEAQQLGHVPTYCDTDSLYYIHKDGTPFVLEGEQIGQMKREHADRNIREFISGGPKQYGIRHVDRHSGADERADLKLRSFRLNYDAEHLINFESVKRLVLQHYNIDGQYDMFNQDNDFIAVHFPQIGRTQTSTIFTREAQKIYRPVYRKGRVNDQLETLPFGYRV